MTSEKQGIIVLPGTGESHETSDGGSMAFIAAAEDTAGAYAFREFTMPPGGLIVQPHCHHRTEETFYIRAGEMTFLVGDQTVIATPGTYILVPRGVTHAFCNRSDAPATFAMIDSPPNIAPIVRRFFVTRQRDPHDDVEWLPNVRWVGRPE